VLNTDSFVYNSPFRGISEVVGDVDGKENFSSKKTMHTPRPMAITSVIYLGPTCARGMYWLIKKWFEYPAR
jgi:hypothetical protein